MNNEQISTVADKAWGLASEPDIDFEVCVLLKDCAFTIKELQSRLKHLEKEKESLCKHLDAAGDSLIEAGEKIESLEKDAALLDWLGAASAGCIRMDANPFAPTYINYNASGGDIRSTLTKAMQSQGNTND